MTGADVLGPGQIHLTGDQVVALLRADEDDIAARWADVLTAFLAAQPNLASNDFTETDDAQAAAEMLGAGAAPAQIPPTQVVGGTAMIAAQPDLDELMTQLFGTPTPLRARFATATASREWGSPSAPGSSPRASASCSRTTPTPSITRRRRSSRRGPRTPAPRRTPSRRSASGRSIVSQVSSGLADVTVIVGQDYHG